MRTEAAAAAESVGESTVVETLAVRAVALQRRAEARVVVGVTGPPGCGKSTLAVLVAARIGDDAAVVPMDGFHLRNDDLTQLGRRDQKGAANTFDVDGFIELLHRLRVHPTQPVTFPEFDRIRDEPVRAAGEVAPDVSIVIVEGNYLLTQEHLWNEARPLFDEVWYIDLDHAERLRRLVTRHRQFGMTLEEASTWANGPDEANAVLIERTRSTADLLVALEP